MHKPTSLQMSQIISADAPLLSPTAEHPYHSPTADSFAYNYYLPSSSPNSVGSAAMTESPIPAERVLRIRTLSEEEMCISTQQLFEINEAQHPQKASLEPSNPTLTSVIASQQQRPSISIKPPTAAVKRSASPSPTATAPRKRTVGERISTKDFVPPDVSGLTKREARLVKNRAAAFLSRQRKREEFETMEVRVAELEEENARLLALTQQAGSSSQPQPKSQPENDLVSEVEMLRAQLAGAQQREYELSQELAMKIDNNPPRIKEEAVEPTLSILSPRSQAPHKSAASLGLMVLLCALPTLLSMPTQSPFPTTFSLPTALPTSASSFDFNSILPRDFDWTRNSIMDLDMDEQGKMSSLPQKLEFTNPELSKSLGGLDISFDAVPQEDGKIRVRIHPSSSASSRAGSPGASVLSNPDPHSALGLDIWGLAETDNPSLQASFSSESSSYNSVSSGFTAYSPSSSNGDPFLGVGGPSYNDFGGLSPFSSGSSGDMDFDFGRASEYSPSLTGSDSLPVSKRRVRIALKSLPATGGEGGEWEVQIC
ncbi:hypothetical protein D9757_000506 [Collybiopsis confluens]|uniref:BZIP domain-containing protein n=1 Tax=Collybiopsis confluens TaxID=2823264 RepID=A0A8H5MGR2_9AGAR|nr:hypothetical protein D9757_000506 [Collybiopsis confluens]